MSEPRSNRLALYRTSYLDFGERLPTFMCAVQLRILDDAQGDRGSFVNALPLEMAVEELPLGPL